MKKITINVLAMFFICLVSGVLAESVQIPAIINYQGRLTNPTDGKPVKSGVYNIEFRVWDDPKATGAADLIWGRAFPVHVVTNGLFNILISDAGTEVTSPSPNTNDLRQAFQGQFRYLGMTITHGPDGDISSPEISPRQRMVSSPFAFHAANATHAYEAEQADEARLAQNSERLGDTLADKYYDEDKFDALGLSGSYRTVLGWLDGGIAEKLGLYDYFGKLCLSSGAPSEPDSDVSFLINNDKLQVNDGIISKGPIVAAPGDSDAAGIQFPKNIAGGTGDEASIKYYNVSGESCKLQISVANDSDDDMELRASGKINMYGDVHMHDGLAIDGSFHAFSSLVDEWDVLDDGTFSAYPSSDGFYYVYARNVSYHVTIGSISWFLRSESSVILMQVYPVAAGEYFKVKEDDNLSGPTYLEVYWRGIGE